MAHHKTEMDALLNTAREEELSDGRKFKIFAVPWVHGEKFSRAAQPVFRLYAEGEAANEPLEKILVKLMSECSTNLLDLAECCTTLSRQELDYLQLDDAILVCGAVLAVNLSFFTQRLQGRLPVLLQKLLGGMESSGLNPPSDSSQAVIDSKT